MLVNYGPTHPVTKGVPDVSPLLFDLDIDEKQVVIKKYLEIIIGGQVIILKGLTIEVNSIISHT